MRWGTCPYCHAASPRGPSCHSTRQWTIAREVGRRAATASPRSSWSVLPGRVRPPQPERREERPREYASGGAPRATLLVQRRRSPQEVHKRARSVSRILHHDIWCVFHQKVTRHPGTLEYTVEDLTCCIGRVAASPKVVRQRFAGERFLASSGDAGAYSRNRPVKSIVREGAQTG